MFLHSGIAAVFSMIAGASAGTCTPGAPTPAPVSLPDGTLPLATSFAFTAAQAASLTFAPASTATLSGRGGSDCSGNVGEDSADVLRDVAIGLLDRGQGCYATTAYSNGDYVVEFGLLNGGGKSFPAFRVNPPTSTATEFVATGSGVFYSIAVASKVYKLVGGSLALQGNMDAPSKLPSFDDSGIRVDSITEAQIYAVLPATTEVPEASSITLSGLEAKECGNSPIPMSARFGDLALVVAPYDNTCWTDTRYAHSAYLIEKGTLEGTDGTCVVAYKVHPHSSSATEFKASDAKVYLKIPSGHRAFRYAAGIAQEMDAQAMTLDGLTDSGIVASTLTSPIVVFVAESGQRFSALPMISNTVAGAWLSGSSRGFSLQARSFPVDHGEPHDPTVHWTYGPAQHEHTYQDAKQFVSVSRADGKEGVVWPDASTGEVYMTWLAADMKSAETVKILTPSPNEVLYAATANGQDSIILLTVANQNPPPSKSTPGIVQVVKVNSATGAEVQRATLSGLNFWEKFSSAASAVWDSKTDTVAVMFSRKTTVASDGLNHQGCIAFLLDGTTLEIKKNLGQTSGHSWSNTILLADDNSLSTFIGLDLGDNYPRGVNVHRISESKKQSRVVYTFKTQHSTGCTGSDVYYTAGGESYCKQSNDNKVYTEIGHPGVVEVNDGLLVFFAGEQSPLDNTKIGQDLNAPRDLGYVKVSKDLQTILSPGETETGGFYNFNGGWSKQENKGINFLTAHTSTDESVSRLKTFKLSTSSVLLTYEVWTKTSYVRTELMEVDASGGTLREKWRTCFPMRLAIADDGIVINGKAIAYAGSSGRLIRYEICAGANCPGPAGGPLPTVADGCTFSTSPTPAPGMIPATPAPPAPPESVAPLESVSACPRMIVSMGAFFITFVAVCLLSNGV